MKKATPVRRSLRVVGFILLALLPALLYGKNYDADAGLELSFRLFDKDVPVKEYAMVVFKDGVKLDSFTVKKDKEIYLLLDLNSSYTVSITKAHFKERLIMAETKVPSGKEGGEYNYSFDVNMISDTAHSEDVNDIPVMLIKYDQASGSFFSSQPEGISVADPSDVVTNDQVETPKQDAQVPVPAKRKGLRTMVIRKK
jgi:hypothetical protein